MNSNILGYISQEEAEVFSIANSYTSPSPYCCIHMRINELCKDCHPKLPQKREVLCWHWRIEDKCKQCSKKF